MLGIILARGGSKGLPGKNIMPLCGKPMIAYTIEAALSSKSVDRLVLSTDDEEIAEISKKYGAEVPFMRPDYLAGDTAVSQDVINYTVERLSGIDEYMLLQPTSPLRTNKHIDAAYNLYKDSGADSLVSITEVNHPIQWCLVADENCFVQNKFENGCESRQSYDKLYLPNGAIYIDKYPQILNKRIGYIMTRETSIDIDTMLDYKIAEMLIKNKM